MPCAAPGDNDLGSARDPVMDCAGNRPHGDGNRRRHAIGTGHTAMDLERHGIAEVLPPRAARWRLAEVPVGQEACDLSLVHGTVRGECAVAVIGKRRIDEPGHGIDQHHARSRVERERAIVDCATPDIGDVGHAADVEQYPRAIGGAEEQHVRSGHERRTLPSRGDVA